MIRQISVFSLLIVLGGVPLTAQDARSNPNQRRTVLGSNTQQKGDSLQRRAQARNPGEVTRARQEQKQLRQGVEVDARRTGQVPVRQVQRGNAPDIRTVSVSDSVTATNAAANAANAAAVINATNVADAPVPRITQPKPADTLTTLPPRSRPRAAIMRAREQPNAPPFCDSGAGHPLFGREWCHERGFRLGDDWERARARNIAVDRSMAARGPLDDAAIHQLFGAEFSERLLETRTALELKEPITTRWLSTPTGGSILVLVSGSTVLGELVDRDRDGLADVVWLARRR